MKTLTPQERAESHWAHALETGEIDSGHTLGWASIHGYLAGDKDREVIEAEKREAAAKGFDACMNKIFHWGKDEGDHTQVFTSGKAMREFYQAARADRQELVDCVLGMASALEYMWQNDESPRKICICYHDTFRTFADLINRLKSEVRTK